MRALLVTPRWSELEGLLRPSNRPLLDLMLLSLGYDQLDTLEIDPAEPFDPTSLDAAYAVVIIQAQGESPRLRRGVISRLGLSLGLDGETSSTLRVVGAKPLRNGAGDSVGFLANRRGRVVAYCDHTVGEVMPALEYGLRVILTEEAHSLRRLPFSTCRLVECAGEPDNITLHMDEQTAAAMHRRCKVMPMPNGDTAVLIPHEDVMAESLPRIWGNRVYAQGAVALEQYVAELLWRRGWRVATAESCTAGLTAARLSAVPGSSDYLDGGWVVYSNGAKSRLVEGIEPLIERCGAVSAEVALALARGALKGHAVDLAVAITGVAGPGGGSETKPVGTVFLAVVSKEGNILEHRGFYHGNRDRIRYQASQTALHLLRRLAEKVGS
ncbi:competence/damage-inducible protein cinA [Magnetococcus marinus MC-1]|uniref:Competence/damage-inducible protein cinA n=1 Tax=Magnetococcus marinus (strain ATCC BAA-1437 / JCM 17883 / MC-1) TaxID=156889 RepID=A0L4X4_MAGMM|nr:nicotinamide-nucleotide amidohydrolase family protein [Magnetococcus marinus]ABK43017.1 competence/damage-inducible protein cinA [Magnetococcus marinus MC-1]